jgi:hypothetical protein
MTANAVFSILVLPAVVFALAYFPAVTKLSRGLLSPYAKADVRKRLAAATIDGLLVTTSCFLSWKSDRCCSSQPAPAICCCGTR